GYFADAAGWALNCLQSDERAKANEKVIDGLVGDARTLLETAGCSPPADHSDDVGAILEALVLASTAEVPEARATLDRLLTTLAYVETGQPAGPEEVPGEPVAPVALTAARVAAYLGQRFGHDDVAAESVTTTGGG